jgi:dynein heavy chain
VSKKTGRTKLSYWRAAQSKHVLGNPRLTQLLMEFDRNKITPELMMQVEKVLSDPEFTYEKAYTASAAATGIFKWVKATRDYFYIFKEVEPRRDAFMLSNKQLLDKKQQLEEKQARIAQLDTALLGLKEHQQSKDAVITALH